jgi:hypothetical protein
MSLDTSSKLDKLAEKMEGARADQLEEVVRMRKTLKAAMLKKSLKEHPALTELLSLLRKRETSYSLLLSNKPMDDRRTEWFARRAEVRFIISFFEVDKTIEHIDAELDYQLSDEVDVNE